MVTEEAKERIIADYDAKLDYYATFCSHLEHMLSLVLNSNGIQFHQITSRLKSRKSFIDKLSNPKSEYLELADVTDLVGLRIITYFTEDIARVTDAINDAFTVHYTQDKKEVLGLNSFGYLSIHQIISLHQSQVGLPVFKDFNILKAEVQIRSVLQHAWAEIEHDLGYKGVSQVPPEFQRRFAQIAGILESSDNEFGRLKKELAPYKLSLPDKVKNTPDKVLLSLDSLKVFIETSETISQIDEAIRLKNNIHLHDWSKQAEQTIYSLQEIHINTISELESMLIDNKQNIVEYAQKVVPRGTVVPNGICLNMLFHFWLSGQDEEAILAYYKNTAYANPEQDTARLIAIGKEIREITSSN